MAVLLANPAVMGALGAAAVPVGQAVGDLAGKGLSKLGGLFGLKKGGTLNPKQMTAALNKATINGNTEATKETNHQPGGSGQTPGPLNPRSNS